jgi:hypothetical protein
MGKTLGALIGGCGQGDSGGCTIIEALAHA